MRNASFQLKWAKLLGFLAFTSFAATGCGDFWQPPSSGNPPPAGASLTLWTNSAEYSHSQVYIASQGVASQPVAGAFYYDNGNTPSGGSTTFGVTSSGTFTSPLYTGSNGYVSVGGLDLNSAWKIYWNWTPVGCATSILTAPSLPFGEMYQNTYNLTPNQTLSITCPYTVGDVHPQVSPQFSILGATGTTFTEVASVPLSTTYGNPQLVVLDRNNNVVSTMQASSVASDGITATFPFPVDSYGYALPADLYSTNLLNVNADGTTSFAGGLGSAFSIASMSQSYPGAFGVAAANTTSMTDVCTTYLTAPRHTQCNYVGSQASYPVVTLSTQNKVSIDGQLVNVGTNPTAIISYGTNTANSSSYSSDPSSNTTSSYSTTTTGTGYAIVANTGDGTVSILDILNRTVLATVAVGAGPVALAVSPDDSTAYVANYTDGTISRINLSTNSVTLTQPIGSMPSSLDLDVNGNLWVGGAGYLTELDPNSLAVVSTLAQSGNVTTMAISKQLNSVVATIVSNTSGVPSGVINYNSANVITSNMALASGNSTIQAHDLATPIYGTSGAGTTAATPGQMANGILVSANYGNALSASLTPTGFIVQDLSGNTTLMTGILPSVGRGIAVDPDYGYIYITLPDSSAVVTIPLPNEPTD